MLDERFFRPSGEGPTAMPEGIFGWSLRVQIVTKPVEHAGHHLLIDAVGTRAGGGATVALALLHAALDDARVGRVTLTSLPDDARSFVWPVHPKLHVLRIPATAYPARMAWHSAGLGALARAVCADRVLDLNALGHTPGVPRAALIQQPAVLDANPSTSLPLAHRRRLRVIRALTACSARRASVVLTQRPGVAAQAEAWLGRPALWATPHATWHDHTRAAPNAALDAMAADDGPRILYLGSDLPTKRLDLLHAALRRMQRVLPATLYCSLPAAHPMVRGVPSVVGLGALTRAEVQRALGLAGCLVLPSEVETVGLPLVEAMACGCPAVAPALPYAREVGAGALSLYRPGNIGACADAIVRVLRDPAHRADLIQRGHARHAALVAASPYGAMLDALLGAP
jgi:glycosyltransferase involved in cell wall biosynthesis